MNLGFQGDTAQIVAANIHIRNSGVPNYVAEKFRVQSQFDLVLLDKLLQNYHDRRLLQFLMFGFPIDHDGSPVTLNFKNHKGVSAEFEEHVQHYLDEEIKQGAVLGPFKEPPFPSPCATSLINLVPKKDLQKRRIILDLSFLQGALVNDGIKADYYLGERQKLVFPSIDDLVKILHKKGPGCLLFKRDLSRAYRQLRVDLGSINLLGYYFRDNYYFDTVLPMGLRSAVCCCQMFTDAITFIFQEEGFDAVNYIDDSGGVETSD